MPSSTSRPHVALLSDAAGIGGAELYLELLIDGLRDRYRFAALLGDRSHVIVEDRLRAAGASVERIHGLRRYPTPGAVSRARARIRALAPSVVHVNLTDQGGGLGPLAAARLAGVPIAATLHLVIPSRSRGKEALSARALSMPDVVICVSEAVARYASQAAKKTVVVHPAVRPPEPVANPREAMNLPTNALVVGGIGRLHDQKGWDVLCDASTRILRELPEVIVAVVGDGPEGRSLRRRLSCAGVRFLGHRDNASSLVQAFDVFVAPSRYEAFGLVALEAMHAGVPVIASDIGGLPEVVASAGVLVPAEDPEALAEAVVRLARDPAARAALAYAGRERARTAFSVERMAEETARVYDSLGGRGVRRPPVH